jgi:lysylphosphatidylglycerol synthetase-like protein (DUF2156 family)
MGKQIQKIMEDQTKKINDIQTLLKFTYGLIPIIAGADKFTNLLTDWSHYLSPAIQDVLPVSSHVFMMIVGVIEIIAGTLVFVDAKKWAYLVSAWLVLIAVNLLISKNYYDVAVRDLAMAIGAYSLAKLSSITNK